MPYDPDIMRQGFMKPKKQRLKTFYLVWPENQTEGVLLKTEDLEEAQNKASQHIGSKIEKRKEISFSGTTEHVGWVKVKYPKRSNPISRHYSGHGSSVERKMKKLYGRDWKKVFYATEARRKNPDGEDDLADHEHAMIAAFHLAKLEECYAENGEDEALELTNEALDALCEVIDLQDSEVSEADLEDEEEY